VFLVNSRYPYFRDTYSLLKKIFPKPEGCQVTSIVIEYALLLPKLQSYFAKFLHLLSSIALVYSTRPPVLDFIYFTRYYLIMDNTIVLTYFLFR
jgi:hypothetical protein